MRTREVLGRIKKFLDEPVISNKEFNRLLGSSLSLNKEEIKLMKLKLKNQGKISLIGKKIEIKP